MVARGGAPSAVKAPPRQTTRERALEEAMKEPPKPDMQKLAGKKTGDASDVKKLLEQLNQASVSITSPSDIIADSGSFNMPTEEEPMMNSFEELRDLTQSLLKLGDNGNSANVALPVAGGE